MQHVFVLGAGRVGVEIAVQCALFKKQVWLYDISEEALRQASLRIADLGQSLVVEGYTDPPSWQKAVERIHCTGEMFDGASADLVIECVPEMLEAKRTALASAAKHCRPDAILTTNSSYILPSSLASAVERPERFAGFHFHVPVWRTRIIDVMPHGRTAVATVQSLLSFGAEIGMVPIRLGKETPGYLFNSLLLPLLFQAVHLARRKVASVEDIDRAWMGVTGMKVGPFGMFDVIGLKTAHQVAAYWADMLQDRSARKAAEFLQSQMESASGAMPTFYQYPDPAYARPGFLPEFVRPVEVSQTCEASGAARSTGGFLRLVDSWVPTPEASLLRRPAAGVSVCLSGTGPFAERLANQFRRVGASLVCLGPLGYRAESESIFRQHPANVLVVLVPEGNSGSGESDESLASPVQSLASAYRLVQEWFQSRRDFPLAEPARLVFLLPEQAAPWWQGLRGLAKSLLMEAAAVGYSALEVSAITFPDDQHGEEQVSKQCLKPIETGQSPVELQAEVDLRIASGLRWAFRYQAVPRSLVPISFAQGGQWVFSSDAQGITGACALALARRLAAPVHLLGPSQLPETDYSTWSPAELEDLRIAVMKQAFAERRKPNVAWDTMATIIETQRHWRQMQEEGLAARYHCCDVSDADQLARTLGEIRAAGPICGVVQGAGVEATGSFERKTPEALQATLQAKVTGTAALLDQTRSDPLQVFVAFSSLAGRFGGVGQTDSALANEAMAAMLRAASVERFGTRFTTIHWPAWQQVGIAPWPESSRRMAAAGGQPCLDPDLGAAIFVDEVRFANHDRDVTICHADDLPGVWLDDQGPAARRLPE